MTRGNWITLIILIFLIVVALAIGIFFWTRKGAVYVTEGSMIENVAPTVNGKRLNNVAKSRTSYTPPTYREILGKMQ